MLPLEFRLQAGLAPRRLKPELQQKTFKRGCVVLHLFHHPPHRDGGSGLVRFPTPPYPTIKRPRVNSKPASRMHEGSVNIHAEKIFTIICN